MMLKLDTVNEKKQSEYQCNRMSAGCRMGHDHQIREIPTVTVIRRQPSGGWSSPNRIFSSHPVATSNQLNGNNIAKGT